jgi:hypothetical protein
MIEKKQKINIFCFILYLVIIYFILLTIDIKGNNDDDFEKKVLGKYMLFRYGDGNSDSLSKQLKSFAINTDAAGRFNEFKLSFKKNYCMIENI